MSSCKRSVLFLPQSLTALLALTTLSLLGSAQAAVEPTPAHHKPRHHRVVRHAKHVTRHAHHAKHPAKSAAVEAQPSVVPQQPAPQQAAVQPATQTQAVAPQQAVAAVTPVQTVAPAAVASQQIVGAAINRDPIPLNSGSALVIDESTNKVLLSKQATEVRPIASLTKLMTATVVLDAKLPMDEVIEITNDDVDTLKHSSSRLRPGVRLSRRELLHLALMSSENRAAHALARTYPGGVAACVQAMNRKAAMLGMSSTHYSDPTGLTPLNRSSAHDLALLAKAANDYPSIREFSTGQGSTVADGHRALQYRNTDHLVYSHAWDIMLQKTGYISEAGHCLVLNTVVQGRKVIVVLLDAMGKYSHFGDAERIRNWMQRSSARADLPQLEKPELAGKDPINTVAQARE